MTKLRVFKSILYTFVCLFTSVSVAQVTVDDMAQIHRLFDNYMAKYNHYIQHDTLKREPNLYHEEVMVVSASRLPNVVSSDAFYQQVQSFLDRLKSQGVNRVKWESVSVKPLDDNLAVVSNVAVRFRQDGTVHNRVGATYFVSKHNAQWLIATFAVHEPGPPSQGGAPAG